MPAGKRSQRILLPALLAFAGSAHADFQDDYARGLQAVDAQRWQDARRYLQSAVTAQPDPVAHVILNGTVEQPYLPYHFLGVVAINLGECDVAVKQFHNATNRRMVARIRTFIAKEEEMLAACKNTAVAKEDKPAPAADVPEPAPPSKPVVTENAPPKPPIPDKRPTEKPPAPEPKQPVVATAHAPAPAPLLRAFEDYVNGRYSEAARIDPEFFTDARARFQAYLLRSAARFSLAQLGGDRNLLDEARSDARAAQALEATAPDASVFSPRFKAFYGGAQ